MRTLIFVLLSVSPTLSLLNGQNELENSIIAYYPFEGSIEDQSPNNNDGEVFGQPNFVPGVSGNAIEFDGIDDYALIPHSDGFAEITSEITISMWIKPTGLYNNRWMTILTKLVDGESLTPYSVVYTLENGEIIPYLRFTGENSSTWTSIRLFGTPANLDINKWNFIVWRFDNGNLTIFTNDQVVATYAFEYDTLIDSDGSLELGIDTPGELEYFEGAIDELCFFSAALSDQDINTIYEEGKGQISSLPVTLSSFTGALNKTQVDLQWTTSTESDNAGFEIQRSQTGNDWLPIGFVDGAGDSREQLTYSHSDLTPYRGLNYYRLRQTNVDETFAYSETITVNNDAGTAITIYPNPTANYLNWLPATSKSFVLFNSNGEKVRVGEGTRIDVIGLPVGMYYLKLEGEKLSKVVIQQRGVYP